MVIKKATITKLVVLNAIEILTARETQIMNMIGESMAINTVHSYLTDTLDTAASLAVAEGGDYTSKALTTPSRLTNIVEIIAKNYKVTRTQQQISHYHGENELTRQTEKALMDWGNAAELTKKVELWINSLLKTWNLSYAI